MGVAVPRLRSVSGMYPFATRCNRCDHLQKGATEMKTRGFGRSTSARLRRAGALRTVFVAAALIFGCVALIGATGAAAGPAVTQTMPFTYGGTNLCTGETFLGSGNAHFLLSENL